MVFDHLDYEARFREAVFASGAELAGLGADGQYRLRLYSDLMSETAGGWLAYAELMQRVTVTDEALRASLGDEYDVSYGDGYERIYAEEADFIYYRHSEDEPWTVCYMSELAATDRIASALSLSRTRRGLTTGTARRCSASPVRSALCRSSSTCPAISPRFTAKRYL